MINWQNLIKNVDQKDIEDYSELREGNSKPGILNGILFSNEKHLLEFGHSMVCRREQIRHLLVLPLGDTIPNRFLSSSIILIIFFLQLIIYNIEISTT